MCGGCFLNPCHTLQFLCSKFLTRQMIVHYHTISSFRNANLISLTFRFLTVGFQLHKSRAGQGWPAYALSQPHRVIGLNPGSCPHYQDLSLFLLHISIIKVMLSILPCYLTAAQSSWQVICRRPSGRMQEVAKVVLTTFPSPTLPLILKLQLQGPLPAAFPPLELHHAPNISCLRADY